MKIMAGPSAYPKGDLAMLRSIRIPVVLLLVGVSASLLLSADSGTATQQKTSANVPKELLENRLEAARHVFRDNLQRLKAGQAVCDEGFLSWSERWLVAELAISDKRPDRMAAFKAHVERARELER